MPRQRSRRGFTLIEAAMVTVIIGVGVVGMLQLLATGTISNTQGARLTTAINLANSIHELTLGMSFADPVTPTHWGSETGETVTTYNDIDDLDTRIFSPPIDARRQTLSQYSNWEQAVAVQSVDPDRLTLAVPNGSTPVSRVTVTISQNGNVVYQCSWLAVEPE